MTADYERHEPWPETAQPPVLVIMLAGWIDAGAAAATAIASADGQLSARTIATFDADTFIDYRARRPVMELRDGVNTRLVWPDLVLKYGMDARGRDVLLLTGNEPDTCWHRFSRAVVELAGEFGVRTAVALGAYPFGTPHTRPSRLSVSCSSAALAATLPYLKNSVDVPAGAAAALERALGDAGVDVVGLWAQVPHYVANMPYPGASVALLDGVTAITGVRFDLGDLRADAAAHGARLDELVAGNPEHVVMIGQLESAYDEEMRAALPAASPIVAEDIPSGDELAAELEKFLRDQG
jgi:proteasome assembly chaperone (PAC2) family protein